MIRGNLDKVLFALSYCYFLGIVIFLLAQNKLYLPLISPLVHGDNRAEKPIKPGDARFIDYMQRALTRLERQGNIASSSSSSAEPTKVATPKYTPVPPISDLPLKTPPSIPVPPPPLVPPPPPPTATNPVSPPKVAAKPNETEYTLIGLFESGNNSVALFSLNDVVSRFAIGQEISKTGWFLESVSADSATLVKNGVRRTLVIGQKL